MSLFDSVGHRRIARFSWSRQSKSRPCSSAPAQFRVQRGVLPQCPKLIPPSSSRSHGKHAQGAGLVLQTQDAVGDSFQMARQPHPDVLNIPARQRAVGKQMRSWASISSSDAFQHLERHIFPASPQSLAHQTWQNASRRRSSLCRACSKSVICQGFKPSLTSKGKYWWGGTSRETNLPLQHSSPTLKP